ncbi:hypothetical protein T02_10612 [Trichinella nativa]|uniref:Uncharacterized protein n=1 Tax=Trichinella nativa TaxID=6335 RepID=A0A0V1KRQ3_9BILA|nr:hypothetical protein T06_4246 [Trichinella sp. T6]KRZ49952.1 hypothetical protein T02_10612 [Trichinella nativa]
MELHLAKFNGEKVKHARPYRNQKPTNAKNQFFFQNFNLTSKPKRYQKQNISIHTTLVYMSL